MRTSLCVTQLVVVLLGVIPVGANIDGRMDLGTGNSRVGSPVNAKGHVIGSLCTGGNAANA